MEEYYGNVDGCGVRSPSGGGLTESQLMVLRCYYNAINKWPRDKDLTQVSTATLLTIPTIQAWFENKRNREERDRIETEKREAAAARAASQSAAKGKGSTKGQAQPKKSVSIPHQVGKDIQLMLLLFYPDGLRIEEVQTKFGSTFYKALNTYGHTINELLTSKLVKKRIRIGKKNGETWVYGRVLQEKLEAFLTIRPKELSRMRQLGKSNALMESGRDKSLVTTQQHSPAAAQKSKPKSATAVAVAAKKKSRKKYSTAAAAKTKSKQKCSASAPATVALGKRPRGRPRKCDTVNKDASSSEENMDTGNMESDEVEIDSPTALNIDINWQEILPEPEIPVTAAQPQPVTQNDEVVIGNTDPRVEQRTLTESRMEALDVNGGQQQHREREVGTFLRNPLLALAHCSTARIRFRGKSALTISLEKMRNNSSS